MADPPFITLAAGGVQAKSDASIATHNTSRTKYHMSDIGIFAARLENAAASIFPNKGRSRYKKVHVLLLRWEEDTMGVALELEDLAKTFTFVYGFETEIWLIPTVKSHVALTAKALQTVQDFGGPDDLLIVYYGGHGLINDVRQGVWTCDSDLNRGSLLWYAIQPLFEQADSDVLLLLDCCAAASGAPTASESISVTETIAACGFETWAPRPGRHSFTNTLIAVLEDWTGRTAFTAAMLHCEILQRLRHEKPERYRNTDKFEYRKSPIHVLSTNDRHARSVELCPRKLPPRLPGDIIAAAAEVPSARGASISKSARNIELGNDGSSVDAALSENANSANQTGDLYDIDSLAKIHDNGDTVLPHVLITLALEDDPSSTLEFEPWKRWLQQNPALIKYAKVQGVYKSNSTFMLLSVPVLVWDWIPNDPACVFIGYVHSDNLLNYTVSVSDRSIESVGDKIFVEFSRRLDMLPEKREHLEEGFENSWQPEFSIRRKFFNDTTYASERMIDGDEDILGFFDSMDMASPCEVEVLEEFCRGISLEDLASGRGAAGCRRAVWLDDRCGDLDLIGSGQARQYINPLTATGLYRALKQPRFNRKDEPDAERRLIYITDLDPAYITALAATASYQQASVLRDAICQYLSFQTSIAVKFPRAGCLFFQLDLHLPFFVLRKATPPEASIGKANTKPRRRWTDLSFLKLNSPESQGHCLPNEVWGIHEVQISCVVTGSDEWRWVAYGFVDTEVDGLLTDLSETDLSFDPIAAGEMQASYPIWRPRDYWLKVLGIRIEQVRREWEYLLYKLELGVQKHIDEHRTTVSRSSENARRNASEIRETLHWTLQTMDLLRRLDGVLLNLAEAWKPFKSPHGDIGYFLDTKATAPSPFTRRSIVSINITFRQIHACQKRMAVLIASCSDFSQILKIRLAVESKETASDNGLTFDFTISILYPVTLTAGIFSMQPAVIPFDLNPTSFGLVVFLLIVTVYAIRRVTPYVQLLWSLWRTKFTSWIKQEKKYRTHSGGLGFPSLRMAHSDPNKVNVEPLGTRALLERKSDTEWDAWSDKFI